MIVKFLALVLVYSEYSSKLRHFTSDGLPCYRVIKNVGKYIHFCVCLISVNKEMITKTFFSQLPDLFVHLVCPVGL